MAKQETSSKSRRGTPRDERLPARAPQAHNDIPMVVPVFATAEGDITIPADVPQRDDFVGEFQRAAMEWAYIVRNRHRWANQTTLVTEQCERAHELLTAAGFSENGLSTLARAGVVQVIIPDQQNILGWETRVFPWEFVLSAAVRDASRDEPITVLRQLTRAASRTRETRRPQSVLYVESAPGSLDDIYDFRSERELVLDALSALTIHTPLINPTRIQLKTRVEADKPDIIHLAGFDTHQALSILESGDLAVARHSFPQKLRDGYVLSGDNRTIFDPIDFDALADCVCPSSHKPLLVSSSFWNSASRVCPKMISKGVTHAIGFQDSFDDGLMESFFRRFYRYAIESNWDWLDVFVSSLDRLREHRSSIIGTGVVFWSSRRLVRRRDTSVSIIHKTGRQSDNIISPPKSGVVDDIVSLHIKPWTELNYSLLHNRRPLFDQFKIVNKRATSGRLKQVYITVDLNAGGATFPYRCCVDVKDEVDLRNEIHAALTTDLQRAIRESVSTSLFVEVSWNTHVLYRQTHRVSLLPPDQWRDDDTDRIWLPSFVFPRDPAISKLIETSHRYIRVLRDDPTAGFDGYQSIDSAQADPAEGVDLQVEAIWAALIHDWRLGYINPPPTYSRGQDSQRLRTPSTVYASKSGTCIDLALLFAAALELIDIYPVIFLLNAHAFAGYWRSNDAHGRFLTMLNDRFSYPAVSGLVPPPGARSEPWISGAASYAEIVRQVDDGLLIPVETVSLTEHSGFGAAIDAGKENLQSQREFESMIDILSARKDHVTPLPLNEVSIA